MSLFFFLQISITNLAFAYFALYTNQTNWLYAVVFKIIGVPEFKKKKDLKSMWNLFYKVTFREDYKEVLSCSIK